MRIRHGPPKRGIQQCSGDPANRHNCRTQKPVLSPSAADPDEAILLRVRLLQETAVVCPSASASRESDFFRHLSSRNQAARCRFAKEIVAESEHPMENVSPENTTPENVVAIEIAERMAARNSACAGALAAFALFSLVWMAGYAWLTNDPHEKKSVADRRFEKLPSSEPVQSSPSRVPVPVEIAQSPAAPTVPVTTASWKGRSFFTHATSREFLIDDSMLKAEEDSPNLELSFEPGPATEKVYPDPKPVEFAPVSSELPAPQIPVSADQSDSKETRDSSRVSIVAETAQVGSAEPVARRSPPWVPGGDHRATIHGPIPQTPTAPTIGREPTIEPEVTAESTIREPLEKEEQGLSSVEEVNPEPTVFSVFLANKPSAPAEILFLSHYGQGHWYEPGQESTELFDADQPGPTESIGRLASDDSRALYLPANWTLGVVSDYAIGPRLVEIFGEVRGRWARAVSSARPQEPCFSNRELALRWVDELQFGQFEVQSFSPDAD